MRVIRCDRTQSAGADEFVQGVARPRVVVGPQESEELRVTIISFEPSGHNVRHTHSFDQVPHTIQGAGFVATDDERQVVNPGDVAVIPAGEPH
jgi:quercetin dioxygenase-like cupin family protein